MDFIKKLFGGGGGGGTPSYPVGQINKINQNNVRAMQRDAYGTIDAGKLKGVDAGKLKNLGKGKFAVVDNKGKTLKTFSGKSAKDEANKFIKGRQGTFNVVDSKGKTLKTFSGKNAKADANKFISGRKGDPKSAKPLLDEVNRISKDLESKIKAQADGLGRDATEAETKVLDRLTQLEKDLTDSQGVLDDKLRSDVQAALGTFEDSMSLLDQTDRAEFEQNIADFRSQAADVESQFQADTDTAISDFDTRSMDALSDYEATTDTLGDTFSSAVDSATGDYESLMSEAGDLSPERLSIFSQAADFLSRAAVDTRMNMLATADPRALELSAIADENAAAMMSGRIGADTQANLSRSSAMRALQGGFGASSEMGRGLAARDLGLTSLDLMNQGAKLNESQRRLNYDTRVAGLQADAGQLLVNDQNRLTNQANTLFDAGLRTAESNRNFGETAAGRILGGNLAVADQVRGDRMGIANQLFGSRMDTANTVFGNSFNNLANRTQRQAGVAQTRLTGESSTAEAIYNRGTENLRQSNSTQANLYGTIYGNELNTSRNQRGMLVDAAGTRAANEINTRTNLFGAINAARSQAASNMIQATQNNYTASLQRAQEQNAGIGSLIGMGGSVIGGALGLIATGGNPLGAMAGSTVGGSLGATAAGSLGYGGYSGGAQGANTGSSLMGFLSAGLNSSSGGSSFSAPSGWNSSKGNWFNYSS